MKLKKYNNYLTRKSKKTKTEEIRCINCGEKGHIYMKCSYPIQSYGIISLKLDNINLSNLITLQELLNNNQHKLLDKEKLVNSYNVLKTFTETNIDNMLDFLLIKRRNTIAIIEFIRGKYKIKNYKYLLNLFYQMTNKEKEDLLNLSFDDNWKKIWLLDNINSETHVKEYNTSKKKYMLLKDGIISNNIEVTIEKLIKHSCNRYVESEWGFPKGRKNFEETEIECALREFEEETNINKNNINLLDINYIDELYMSTNNIKYKHTYYISQYINKNNKLSITKESNIEIDDIKWFKYKDAISKIRDYSIQKKNVINTVFYNIKNLILDTKRKLEEII